MVGRSFVFGAERTGCSSSALRLVRSLQMFCVIAEKRRGENICPAKKNQEPAASLAVRCDQVTNAQASG
jgi:hypothetical protein